MRFAHATGLAAVLTALVACGGAPAVMTARPLATQTVAASRPDVVTPTVSADQASTLLRSEQVGAVATEAQRSVVDVQTGATARAAIVAGQGIALFGAPAGSATVEARLVGEGLGSATVVVDELRGIAAVSLGPNRDLASIPRGSTVDMRPGTQAVFVSEQGAPPLVGTYVGEAVVPAGGTGLGRVVLVFSLPDGAVLSSGVALDKQGRLIGILSGDRSAPSAVGRVHVVPVEQLEDLLNRARP